MCHNAVVEQYFVVLYALGTFVVCTGRLTVAHACVFEQTDVISAFFFSNFSIHVSYFRYQLQPTADTDNRKQVRAAVQN